MEHLREDGLVVSILVDPGLESKHVSKAGTNTTPGVLITQTHIYLFIYSGILQKTK